MTTQEFLIELRRLDVDLWLEGDRVRCSAPPDVLTAERRAELARRKTEIEVLLKAARAAAPGSIVPIETCGSGLPFYAVPGHNGDVFCFVRLARCLGTERAVLRTAAAGTRQRRIAHRDGRGTGRAFRPRAHRVSAGRTRTSSEAIASAA